MGLCWLLPRTRTCGSACGGSTCSHYKWIEILTQRKTAQSSWVLNETLQHCIQKESNFILSRCLAESGDACLCACRSWFIKQCSLCVAGTHTHTQVWSYISIYQCFQPVMWPPSCSSHGCCIQPGLVDHFSPVWLYNHVQINSSAHVVARRASLDVDNKAGSPLPSHQLQLINYRINNTTKNNTFKTWIYRQHRTFAGPTNSWSTDHTHDTLANMEAPDERIAPGLMDGEFHFK